MNIYSHLDQEALMNLLVEETEKLLTFLSKGIYDGDDYIACRESVKKVEEEILRRLRMVKRA